MCDTGPVAQLSAVLMGLARSVHLALAKPEPAWTPHSAAWRLAKTCLPWLLPARPVVAGAALPESEARRSDGTIMPRSDPEPTLRDGRVWCTLPGLAGPEICYILTLCPGAARANARTTAPQKPSSNTSVKPTVHSHSTTPIQPLITEHCRNVFKLSVRSRDHLHGGATSNGVPQAAVSTSPILSVFLTATP
jgi:hypothetical protein